MWAVNWEIKASFIPIKEVTISSLGNRKGFGRPKLLGAISRRRNRQLPEKCQNKNKKMRKINDKLFCYFGTPQNLSLTLMLKKQMKHISLNL